MLARGGAVCALLATPLSARHPTRRRARGPRSAAARRAIYAGTNLRNVWAIRDAGATWQEAYAGLPRTERGTAYALAVAPGRPDTVYLGSGLGVFRTEDGGRSSRDTGVGGIPNVFPVLSLAVDPRDPHRVYAATGGGLYRSGDDGRTWIRPARLPLGIPLTLIAINPHEPSEVVAYTTYSNSPHNPSPPGCGYDTAYRSTDSGASWSALKGISRASALLFDPAAPDTVLVSGENSLYAVATMGATPPIADLPECYASTLAASRVALPIDAVPPPAGGSGLRYFAQAHHTLGNAFLAY